MTKCPFNDKTYDKAVTVKFDKYDYENLIEYCEKRGITVSRYIRELVYLSLYYQEY